MTKRILYTLGGFFVVFIILLSCRKDRALELNTGLIPVVDLPLVPYPKLSDYKFFIGELKYQLPARGVVSYAPASSLFTDYSLKKRFIWMPRGQKAKYTSDNEILDMPIGTVLIKTFYYTNVLPNYTTRIIETRLLIHKSEGWVFANYVWNAEQTEAYLTTNASTVPISWVQNNKQKSANYRVPSQTECLICHKKEGKPYPIGIKPQNLNHVFGNQNQLHKLIDADYLEADIPGTIASTVDYRDQSKSLDLRLRSYLDANCAHCHSEGKHCDYRPIRLGFSETANPVNIGLCVTPNEMINPSITAIISPDNPKSSVMHLRMSTNQANLRMPLLGRTIVHEEGVKLLEDWIHSKKNCN